MRKVLTLLLAAGTAFAAAEDTDEVVRLVANAPHGPSELSGPEIVGLMAQIRAQPRKYVPALLRRLAQLENANEAAFAATVLVEIGGEEERARVAARVTELFRMNDAAVNELLDAHKRKTPREKRLPILKRLEDQMLVQRAAFDALGKQRDARLRDVVLDRIGRENFTVQMWQLDYLEKAAPGDPQVKKRLRELYDAPGSSLRQIPRVRAIVEKP